LKDYLELVESVGRCLHPGKRGRMPETTPRLLQRLNIDLEQFITWASELISTFGRAIGAPDRLTRLCARRQVRFLRGMRTARAAFGQRAA
jgi:hypothetical protein